MKSDAKKDKRPIQVLIVDDEAEYGDLIRAMLDASYETTFCDNGEEALDLLFTRKFDFVLCDVQMPEISGVDVLNRVREAGLTEDGPTFVMMSAFGTLDTALDCLKAGAYDYISKPFKRDEIRLTLAKAVERERLRGRVHELEDELKDTYHFENIVARSDIMDEVFSVLRKVAGYTTTILITGESGTGKELIARALHYTSPRCNKKFVAINCGAIPENLLESELFGYVRGAFTDAIRDKKGLFEEANGGTLFLDEVGELPLGLQVKLLRVLQEKEIRRIGAVQITPVDVRVVAATVRDLGNDVKEGKFREDLYYRLNVIPVNIPPLRERPEDIPLLLEHFLRRTNQKNKTKTEGFSKDAVRELVAYTWKGNVRELENVVEHCSLLSEQNIIGRDDLPNRITGRNDPKKLAVLSGDLSIKKAMRMIEESLIRKALQKTGGNRTQSAKLLEISHRALLYKIKDYGIDA